MLINSRIEQSFMTKGKNLNRIKSVLAEQEKSGIWLADKLGITPTTVSSWCTNKRQPSLETLAKIAALLNVDISELLAKTKKK